MGRELEEQECGGFEIQGWDKLRDQIKEDLAKGAKTLPLSHINQLILIWNFSNLQLKVLGISKQAYRLCISGMKGKASTSHERLGHSHATIRYSSSSQLSNVEARQTH